MKVTELIIGNVLFLIPELLLEQRKLFSLWMTIQVCHPECINLIGSNYLTRIFNHLRLFYLSDRYVLLASLLKGAQVADERELRKKRKSMES